MRRVETLEIFSDDPGVFDLVITDMTMPNMTGKELAHKLKILRSEILIIICTEFGDQIDKEKAKGMGIDTFLMEPITMAKMANSIRRILD